MDRRIEEPPAMAPPYEIRVAGVLDATWSESLCGLSFSYEDDGGGKRSTVLAGALDQAALAGVLDRLFDLGLTVLSVNRSE